LIKTNINFLRWHFLRSNKYYFYAALLVSLITFLKIFVLFFYLKRSTFQTKDSSEYIISADNFFDTYFTNSPEFLTLGLRRTPGYPLFISLFNSTLSIIFLQIILHMIITIIGIAIYRNISKTKNTKNEFLVFTIIQIESSLLVYSFRLLTDILFATLVALLVYLIMVYDKDKKIRGIELFLFGVVFLMLMVRPIGIGLISVFLILIYLAKDKNLYKKLLIFTIVIIALYSSFNYSKAKMFVVSTIQNEHLLFFQGAGARAITESKSLSVIELQEENLRNKVIGEDAQIKETNSYNGQRGYELIWQNKISFVKLNAQGVVKNLYGPNRFELQQLVTDEGRSMHLSVFAKYIVWLSFVFTFLISSTGILGMIFFARKNEITKIVIVISSVLILMASGAGAYGRFRVPVSMFLSVYSVIFLNRLFARIRFKNFIHNFYT
jgi:hypothetical protein